MASASHANKPPMLSPETLGGEIVRIYVGPKRKAFTIHKKPLCDRSEYFNAAFNSGFQEGSANEMHLPEDTPVDFTNLVNYIYQDRLPSFPAEEYTPDFKGSQGFTRDHLYPLFLFAEKLCINDLANRVMDDIQDIHLKYNRVLSNARILTIYRTTHENSKFRLYSMLNLVRNSVTAHDNGSWCEKRIPLFTEITDIAVDFATAACRYAAKFAADQHLDPRIRDDKTIFGKCFFHTHTDKEVCHLKIHE
ncbi:uncharacterized protein PAC_10991 [Phialocephala subalpina]|uniref:BTB domain-containing protein n=1 Tax=Phialocephala subalpina TaxID=576137 RepID=A0A1L7X7U0_9HELO|nr:uncharacterized protein PAC_10991 [Phialocephala subalpina]